MPAPRIQTSPPPRRQPIPTFALLLSLTLGCDLRPFAGDPKTSGDDPRINTATRAPAPTVPYGPGGTRAERACTVGDLPVNVGDRVTRTTVLTTVDENGILEVYINVPVQQAPQLKLGLPVRLRPVTTVTGH